jgi:hypothetical protein
MNVPGHYSQGQAGDIKAYKIGKEWRIPEQSVFEWLESNVNSRQTPVRRAKAIPNLSPEARLEAMPLQPSGRKHLLEYILAQFEPNRVYSEQEVNRIVARFYHDTATVRREFLAEGMMDQRMGKYSRRVGYRFSD